MKVLIVDDDKISRVTLRETINHLGFTTSTANSGQEALEAFQHETVNVIISDWHMPGMSGLELCQQIRKISTANYTYFILISSTQLEPEAYIEATIQGIDDFLIKPVNTADISNRLHVAERIIKFTSEIRRLKDLLPICMYCHKVRNDADYWQQIERYIHETTGSNFSHGICPDCFQEHVEPQLNRIDANSNKDRSSPFNS